MDTDNVELQACLDEIRQSASSCELPQSEIGPDEIALLAEALVEENDEVTWTLTNIKYDEPDESDPRIYYSRVGGEEAEKFEYGSMVTTVAKLRAISIRFQHYGRHLAFGLTTDKDDDLVFTKGHGIQITPGGLARAGGLSLEDAAFDPGNDVITVAIVQDHVEVQRNSKMVEVLGPTTSHTMDAKIWIKEFDVRPQLVSTRTCCRVSTINLNGNTIGDAGAKLVAEALEMETTLVTSVDLGNNMIYDDGAARLAEAIEHQHCKVCTLNLSHNSIGDRGTVRIAEALGKGTCAVTHIDLTDNDIGDDGATALAEALEKDTCPVTSIKLALNKIGEAGMVRLADTLETQTCKVTTIALGRNNFSKQARTKLSKVYAATLRLDVA